jgi:death-on-curing protein
MRFLSLAECLRLYEAVMNVSGGSFGLWDSNALESALAQPRAAFGGQDLYPTLADKVAALGFSLINNHPFIDGNKRIGHASMEMFLLLNGYEINAPTDEQEELILSVAAGNTDREDLRPSIGFI